MIDVGAGTGALIIYTSDALRGTEIEIRSADEAMHTHTEVLRRKTQSGYVHAGVFGSLAEGNYQLWHESLTSPMKVSIVGGEVTEVDWR